MTAPKPPEVFELRSLDRAGSRELLIGIQEWTQSERRYMNRRDGGGEYSYRVLGTYYFALSLDNSAQTRFATKEEAVAYAERHGIPYQVQEGKTATAWIT